MGGLLLEKYKILSRSFRMLHLEWIKNLPKTILATKLCILL